MWIQIEFDYKIPNLTGHSSLIFPIKDGECKNMILIFGGWNGKEYTNDLYIINTDTH